MGIGNAQLWGYGDIIHKSKFGFFNHPLLEINAPDICNLKSNVYLFIAKMLISSKLLFKKKFNTVRNLIIFSIVFTNKNVMEKFNPSKIRKMIPPIKTKVNHTLIFEILGKNSPLYRIPLYNIS